MMAGVNIAKHHLYPMPPATRTTALLVPLLILGTSLVTGCLSPETLQRMDDNKAHRLYREYLATEAGFQDVVDETCDHHRIHEAEMAGFGDIVDHHCPWFSP